MTRDSIRQKFKDTLKREDIGSKYIALLHVILSAELAAYNNSGFTMCLIPSNREAKINQETGSTEQFYFRVKGQLNDNVPYFDDREAISFEKDWIGFAGWADGTNIKPFLSAFDKWIDAVKNFQAVTV